MLPYLLGATRNGQVLTRGKGHPGISRSSTKHPAKACLPRVSFTCEIGCHPLPEGCWHTSLPRSSSTGGIDGGIVR
ncbi:MAG TPA: hypothetical protein VHU44_08940, partial [Acidobacteriaceae bacterium]|nr:hypothetical protein [Acidobacteriaceae bacterium]